MPCVIHPQSGKEHKERPPYTMNVSRLMNVLSVVDSLEASSILVNGVFRVVDIDVCIQCPIVYIVIDTRAPDSYYRYII